MIRHFVSQESAGKADYLRPSFWKVRKEVERNIIKTSSRFPVFRALELPSSFAFFQKQTAFQKLFKTEKERFSSRIYSELTKDFRLPLFPSKTCQYC